LALANTTPVASSLPPTDDDADIPTGVEKLQTIRVVLIQLGFDASRVNHYFATYPNRSLEDILIELARERGLQT
jgi:hypothetical protein